MEEERRVAYVACTRAEKGLFLSDAEGFDAQLNGGLQTSRFLFDIEENLLEVQGDIKDARDQRARSSGADCSPAEERPASAPATTCGTPTSARERCSPQREAPISCALKTAKSAAFPTLPTC